MPKDQGSFDWYFQRFGLITMSDRINTIVNGHVLALNNLLRTMRWEQGIKNNISHVKAEYERENRLGENVEALAWGRKYEAEAVAHYELTRGVEVERPPFKNHPDWPALVGDSTDFIERDDEGNVLCVGEVKCYFNETNHLKALRYGMDMQHFNQVQGHADHWKAPRVLFLSFDPRCKVADQRLYVQTIDPDLSWVTHMHRRMNEFAVHFKRGTQFEFQMQGARDGIPALF